jgi:long-chain fatty acid transport protein
VVIACGGTAAQAGNVDTYGIGSKAAALGGAFAAYADDPFATYYNPAGLTQITAPMLSVGFNLVKPSLNVYNYQVNGNLAAPAAGPSDFQDHASACQAPHFGFAMPINKSQTLVAAIGTYVPFGLDMKWPGTPDAPGAYNSHHTWYARMVITPSLAVRLTKSLSLGAGVSLGRSAAGAERLAFAPFIPNLHNRQIEMDLKDDGNWSLNFGVLYKPLESISAGLTYRGNTQTHFKGTARAVGLNNGDTLTMPAASLAGPVNNTVVNAETRIDHPEQLQLGVRYLPLAKVSLEVDFVWTKWSRINGYTVSFDKAFLDAPALGPFNPGASSDFSPRNWQDTRQVKLGVEWQVNQILALRGSYFYDPTPIPDSSLDLQWPDADKRTFALGAGLNFGPISMDGVVQYSITDGRRDINGSSTTLNNSYEGGGRAVPTVPPSVAFSADGHVWSGGITINYKF